MELVEIGVLVIAWSLMPAPGLGRVFFIFSLLQLQCHDFHFQNDISSLTYKRNENSYKDYKILKGQFNILVK